MLFAQKTKGYFVELNDHAIMIARTSAPTAPFTVEELRECPINDAAALDAVLSQLQPKKGPGGYVQSTVGVYPARRIVRRHTLELKRVKEPGYMAEICTQQFRIDQDKYVLTLLNSSDGSEFDSSKIGQKDVVFCGMPAEDADAIQSSLLQN